MSDGAAVRPSLDMITVLLKTPTAQLAINGGSQHPDKRKTGGHGPTLADQVEHLLPTPQAATVSNRMDTQLSGDGRSVPNKLGWAVSALLPTPQAMHTARNATANRRDPKPTTQTNGWTLADVAYADRWGDYAPAIARWEQVMGRPAPEPVEPNRRGDGARLAARFVEWLIGCDEGWVTDHVSRNEALAICGNGVVWQQAAAAYAALGVNPTILHGSERAHG